MMGGGALAFIVGIGISVASFAFAASSRSGGRYVVTGGIIFAGAGTFLQGVRAYFGLRR